MNPNNEDKKEKTATGGSPIPTPPEEQENLSTEVTKEDLANAIEEDSGLYSPDGKRLLKASSTTYWDCFSIKEGCRVICDEAFLGHGNLERIDIPDTVTRIGKSVFDQCGSLRSIVIPEGVTTIEDYTFSNCDSLRSIALPKSITPIRAGTFSG